MAKAKKEPGAQSQGGAAAPRAEWRRGRAGLLLFTALLAVYVANFRLRAPGDTFPVRVLPFSILREGNLDLDEFAWTAAANLPWPYYVHKQAGHFYSVSPIATALLITPLYVLPNAWMAHSQIAYDDVRFNVVVVAMERLSAALLAAASALLLFAVLCRFVSVRWALALALLYGLGTSTWSISSQALWPHALSQLCLVALCAVFLHPSPPLWSFAAAGVAAAVAVANRPPMIVFAALAFVYVAARHHRRLPAFLAVPLVVAALLVSYNLSALGQITGGYGGLGHFTAPLFDGITGLLFSPNRGLFVYTPIALFAFWGALRVWRCAAPPWMRYLSVGLLLHLLVYAKFKEWWGGYCFGPRYFTDLWPALTLFLVYGLLPYWTNTAWRVLASALALYGVFVQSLGAYADDDDWNRTPVQLERKPQRVWDWGDLQITRALRNGWHPTELVGVFVDTFADATAAHLAALSSADLASAIEVLEVPPQLPPGATAVLRARLTNRGGKSWPAFSGKGMISVRYLVFTIAQWYRDGRPLPGVGEVVPLAANLAPGESTEVKIPLTAPRQPGDYEIELRVSQAVDGQHGIASPQAVRFALRVE